MNYVEPNVENDKELVAVSRILFILAQFDKDKRCRILDYVHDREKELDDISD